MIAKGLSPRHGPNLARPSGRLSTTRSIGGVPGAAGEGGRGGGDEGGSGAGAGGKPRSAANEDFVLASLTRLDLNNNILHNLDDLKVLSLTHNF